MIGIDRGASAQRREVWGVDIPVVETGGALENEPMLVFVLVFGGCRRDVCTQLAKDADSCGKQCPPRTLIPKEKPGL